MYLETILEIANEKGNVRSIDISEKMNYSKPSISRAVGILKENGYIVIDDNGYITLTDTGRNIAEKIYERHTILSEYLTSLGVDIITATEDACRIEHVISDVSFEAIKRSMKK